MEYSITNQGSWLGGFRGSELRDSEVLEVENILEIRPNFASIG